MAALKGRVWYGERDGERGRVSIVLVGEEDEDAVEAEGVSVARAVLCT